MDRVDRYRHCVQTILEKHSQSKNQQCDVENELLFDPVRDRYLFMQIGWQGLKRVYYTIMHFDIKNNKIWIQQNTTDVDLGQELMEMGINREDIVLGLHPPYKRPYTGYGSSALESTSETSHNIGRAS